MKPSGGHHSTEIWYVRQVGSTVHKGFHRGLVTTEDSSSWLLLLLIAWEIFSKDGLLNHVNRNIVVSKIYKRWSFFIFSLLATYVEWLRCWVLESSRLGFESQLFHFLVYLGSLSFSSVICRTRMIMPASRGSWEEYRRASLENV